MAFENGIGEQIVTLSGANGLNTALSQEDIGDNDLWIGYNFMYEASSGKLVTRGGLECVGLTPAPDPVDILCSFVRKDTEGYVVCVAGSKLYKFNFTTFAWDFVSNLSSQFPGVQAFNGNLYIADGNASGLLKWDGTNAPARLANSPKATAVFTLENRLIANSIVDSELDAVYLSVVESDDFLTTNGALIIRAGYGDGQRVNGFSAISKTLIISKVAYVGGKASKKSFYGINMEGASSGWSAGDISKNNAAIGPHAIVEAGQDVYYLDTQGIEALGPTQKYGDVANDPEIGGKINGVLGPLVRASVNEAKLVSVSNIAAIIAITSSRVYFLSLLTKGFVELGFKTRINHVINHGDEIYLAGDSGYLYRLGIGGTDETAPDVFENYSSILRFKMVMGPGELLLERSFYDIQYLLTGSYKISATSNGKNQVVLQMVDFETPTGTEFLYDAETSLNLATYDLGSTGSMSRLPCRSKFRGNGIAVQVSSYNGGRIAVGKVRLELANVGN